MDIRNVTEFRNLVDAYQLRGLSHSIDAVCNCVMDYERGCNCWKGNARQKIYNNCKALYANAVGTIVGQFSNQFLTKTGNRSITFSQDGVTIGAVHR